MNAMQIIKEGAWGFLFDTCANMTLVLVKFTVNIEYLTQSMGNWRCM